MPNHTIKVKAQCKYKDKDGHRCKTMTTITHPYCAKHTRSVLGLFVAKSTIKGAGLGLFTTRPIKKGTYIVEYAGERMPTKKYDLRYEDESHGEYGMEFNKRIAIDARKTSSGLGRYVCDHYGSGKPANVEYLTTTKRIEITAKKNIEAGEELLVSYGREMRKAMGIIK
jgi:SET domain-containing protein